MLDCKIIVNDFEHQLHYYIHFQTNTIVKGMNIIIPPTMGWMVPLLLFYKDSFLIK